MHFLSLVWGMQKSSFLTRFLVSFLALVLVSSQAISQTLEFIENKGQWHDEVRFKGDLNNGAIFMQKAGYRVVQYSEQELRAVLAEVTGHMHPDGVSGIAGQQPVRGLGKVNSSPKNGPVVLNGHAYDMVFKNANPKASILTERQLEGYTNYFIGNDSSKWASFVKSYATLVYKEIYPGIDARFYSENGFVKYDLVVQPYASLAPLALGYEGVNSLEVKNSKLYITTSVSQVIEDKPFSYQLVNGLRKEVACQYVVSGNTVRFNLKGYDPSKVLVIDPTLIFATFTGSTASNWGYTATYDAAGNAYGGGIAFGAGYPTTAGAFQTTFSGGGNTGESGPFDIAITKLNPTATQRLYATYLGGTSGNEQPHSLIVDGQGNLIIAGRTTSSNYPTTRSTVGSGGLWDIVVTKLNPTGSALVGSVRIGGSSDDGVNIRHKYGGGGAIPASSLYQNYGDDARSEVLVDGNGDILVASCTRSANFPFTPGAAQGVLASAQDALLLKFNSNLSNLVFATAIGGAADDAAYVLTLPPTGNILVAGGTSSADFPGSKTGVVQPNFAGSLSDGFIIEVAGNGGSFVRSTYVGTNGIDQIYGIQLDTARNIYVTGQATGNFPVRNAAFSQPGGKHFIAKLRPDLSAYVYSTVFGTNTPTPNISMTAFLVDRCENVYVSGWGGGVTGGAGSGFLNTTTSGLTVTPDAIKSNTDGGDFYFFVLEKDATRQLYGSFFGQQNTTQVISDHVDGGTSRFDGSGVIYQGICANCQGGQFPVTPGVVGQTNPSGECNQAIIKVSLDLSGIRGKVKSSINGVVDDSAGCVPVTVDFRDSIALAQRYEWTFGDGATANTTTPTTSHTYTNAGNFLVRLIAIDDSKCFPRDTSYINIRVRPDRAVLASTNIKLPPCESNTYQFNNTSIAPPGKPFSNNSFQWDFGDNSPPVLAGQASVNHTFPGPGTYNVVLRLLDTAYCNSPDSLAITLRVSDNLVAAFEAPGPNCAPAEVVFDNQSLGGADFFWDFGDGTTSTDINPTKTYLVAGTYTVKMVARDTNTCNLIDSTTRIVSVLNGPTANFSFSPNPAEENIITTFTNLSDPASFYIWRFGDGDTLRANRRDTLVRHQYPQTGSYEVCLEAISDIGCIDTTCQPLEAIVSPILDVVTAFTPNGDGLNDRAIAIGFGLDQFTFRIYNRWGQLMFETNDIRSGWDGKFKGKDQPMDAYGYTLDAVLLDGTRVQKSGNITLIR